MIVKIILMAILFGLRLGYINLVEPLIKHEIMMTQFDSSAYYVLIQSLPFLDKIYYVIMIILVFLIGLDLYKCFNCKGEKNEE